MRQPEPKKSELEVFTRFVGSPAGGGGLVSSSCSWAENEPPKPEAGVLQPSERFPSTFYDTPPSKNPSKNPCPYRNPYKAPSNRKQAEYGFGEYGFKHRTQWVFRGSLSFGERTQWVPFSLLFVCKRELTEFFPELTEFAQKLSEFSLPKQYSWNSIPPVSYLRNLLRSTSFKEPSSFVFFAPSMKVLGSLSPSFAHPHPPFSSLNGIVQRKGL